MEGGGGARQGQQQWPCSQLSPLSGKPRQGALVSLPTSPCLPFLVQPAPFLTLQHHPNTPKPNTTLTGKPLFGTLISLLHNGVPVVGIIDQPILQERWVGITGQHTTLNGKKINTRMCRDPKLAYLYATTPHMFAGEPAGRGCRGWGRGEEDDEQHGAQSRARQ